MVSFPTTTRFNAIIRYYSRHGGSGMKRIVILATTLLVILAGIVPSTAVHAEGENCLSSVDAPGCMFGLPAGEYQRLLGEMQANPAPEVSNVPVDRKEVGSYTFWRVL